MPVVVVVDPAHVTVDGDPVGSVLDVPENRRDIEGIRGLVLDALNAWAATLKQQHQEQCTALRAQHDAALKDALATQQAEHASALAGQQAKFDAALKAATAKAEGEIASLTATIAGQKAQIDALGGTEMGQRLARQARCKAIHESMAKLKAELAEVE